MQPRIYKSQSVPKTIEYLGANKYYYNYNITSDIDLEGNPCYSYSRIEVFGKPEYNECVKQIIREYLTQEEEFDLINSYNKSALLGETDSENIKKYYDYLELLSNIKEMCKKDLK